MIYQHNQNNKHYIWLGWVQLEPLEPKVRLAGPTFTLKMQNVFFATLKSGFGSLNINTTENLCPL